jgi:hypothetical protein
MRSHSNGEIMVIRGCGPAVGIVISSKVQLVNYIFETPDGTM